VDRHFVGTLSVTDERTMREHLPGCAPCSKRYARHLLLAEIDPEALSERDRLGRGLGFAPEVSREAFASTMKKVAPWLGGALALAAGLLLVASPGRVVNRGEKNDGFQARGAGTNGAELVIYRAAGSSLTPARETIAAGDELAFAYENVHRARALMIFAVDDRDRVYWYHPAWTDERSDPEAIPARLEPGVHMLSEAVRHPFAPGGSVRICVAFGDDPTTVRAIERGLRGLAGFAIQNTRTPDFSSVWKGSSMTCSNFRVLER
jgi:hypothetical protein